MTNEQIAARLRAISEALRGGAGSALVGEHSELHPLLQQCLGAAWEPEDMVQVDDLTPLIDEVAGLSTQLAGGQARVVARLREIASNLPNIADSEPICSALHEAAAELEAQPAGDAGMPVVAYQGGLDNEQLRAAFKRKLPAVDPTDRDLSVFALGVEVGESIDASAWNRLHHVLKRHGLHPGRTDDDIIDITDKALAEVAALHARVNALEQEWKDHACADVGEMLAEHHREVWDAATASDDGRPPVDYDLAGVDACKQIVAAVHARDARIAELEREQHEGAIASAMQLSRISELVARIASAERYSEIGKLFMNYYVSLITMGITDEERDVEWETLKVAAQACLSGEAMRSTP